MFNTNHRNIFFFLNKQYLLWQTSWVKIFFSMTLMAISFFWYAMSYVHIFASAGSFSVKITVLQVKCCIYNSVI